MSKRFKVQSISSPTLFELQVEPARIEKEEPKRHDIPGFFLGTSSFTAKGWEGSFYPRGMNSRDYLSFYSKQFRTLEIDSTFYGTPKPSTVANWKGTNAFRFRLRGEGPSDRHPRKDSRGLRTRV